MANIVDAVFFKELAGQNPEDVCGRALCRYDNGTNSYYLTVWGDEYMISPHESNITRISNNFKKPHEYLYVFIINYLFRAKKIDIYKEWISEKDIPDGAAFFRGPHEIPTHLISSRYNGDIEKFRKVCARLNGIPLDMADAAYAFNITPRIPVAVLYWDGDDEFPPESKLLYDKSITEHLALDIIFALAVDICTRIGR